MHAAGFVSLVGAGPGDPELLTLRAARRLAQAEVVVHDHLVGPGIFALVNPAAELRYVGKQRARHSLPQAELNALLVSLARQGRRVVRLKGGDPFIFGRGGEELQALAAAGIGFEVVPGITAACAAAAGSGIALTHRELAQGCLFVTAHLKDGSCELDWSALARERQSVVVYMGLSAVAHLCERLRAHGLPADWPAALVSHASLPSQQLRVATLGTLAQVAARDALASPSLILLGPVVRLHDELAPWLRSNPWP